jgi:hypothetical protein
VRDPSASSAWVGSVVVGLLAAALGALLAPAWVWYIVLGFCAVGGAWTIWHYIFVDCRQPLKPPIQKMIHEQVPYKPPFWAAYYAEEQRREELLRLAKREAKRNVPLGDEND